MRRCRVLLSADAALVAAPLCRPAAAAWFAMVLWAGAASATGHLAGPSPSPGAPDPSAAPSRLCPGPTAADAMLLSQPQPTGRPAAPPAGLQALADRWLLLLTACEREVDYLLALGRVLNQIGRHAEAGEHLERALLLQPQDPRVRQAFSLSLLGLGDWDSARAMLEGIAADPSASESQRNQAQRSLADLMLTRPSSLAAITASAPSLPQPQWQQRLVASTMMGQDSNLLGATTERSLTLTLPGLPGGDPVIATVPLDPSFAPVRGAYAQAQALGQWRRTAAADASQPSWDLQALLRQRAVSVLPTAGFQQAELSAEHSASPWPLQTAWRLGYYAAASAGHIESRTGVRVRTSVASAGFALVPAPGGTAANDASACSLRVGIEGQWRQYLSNPVLDGRYAGAQGTVACGAPSGLLQLSLRAGHDQAVQASRPGGDQSLYGLRISWVQTLGRAAWSVDAEASHAADAQGYSPLIAQGLRREQARWSVRSEVRHSLRAGSLPVEAFAGLEAYRQNSNLNLFKNSSLGFFLGLRYTK